MKNMRKKNIYILEGKTILDEAHATTSKIEGFSFVACMVWPHE